MSESNWYAVRTAPGAQMPKRVYVTEKLPNRRSKKGYRIVPSLDPKVSAVERALNDAGIVHYMPAEKRLMRDRLRPYLWKSRRFALMVGYIFVRGPIDQRRLLETPGVAGIVRGPDGEALPMSIIDIMRVRSVEAAAEVEFDRLSRDARQKIRKAAKTDPSLAKIVRELDIAGTITVPLDERAEAA